MNTMPEMTAVQSSMVHGYAYDANAQRLYVQFANGATYAYKDVPIYEVDNLKAADSFGKHLNANIKPNYQAERL